MKKGWGGVSGSERREASRERGGAVARNGKSASNITGIGTKIKNGRKIALYVLNENIAFISTII